MDCVSHSVIKLDYHIIIIYNEGNILENRLMRMLPTKEIEFNITLIIELEYDVRLQRLYRKHKVFSSKTLCQALDRKMGRYTAIRYLRNQGLPLPLTLFIMLGYKAVLKYKLNQHKKVAFSNI